MNPDVDLFGEPVRGDDPLPPMEDKRHKTKANGYAARPGSGPAGETCRSCKNYARVQGGARYFPKCLLLQKNWSHGKGTDILARSPACQLWEKPKE